MDTYKEYVLMCSKAKKVQKLWKPIVGDVCVVLYAIFEYFECPTCIIAIDGEGILLDVPDNNHVDKSSLTWLPRQDQLQGMMREEKKNDYQFVYRLYAFVEDDNAGELCGNPSIEQIWLAFVMKEKYNKTWNGKEWIR